MKLFEYILFEDRLDYIANNMGNELILAAKKDKQIARFFDEVDNPLNVIQILSTIDPTPTNKYIQWIANLFVKNGFKYEDKLQVKSVLEKFTKYQNKLEEKDINKYKTLRELDDALINIDPESAKSKREEKRNIKHEGSKVMTKGPDGVVLLLKTEEAACYYGKGTQWCTAATEDFNYFNDYNNYGNIYVFLGADGRKYQMYFQEFEIMDERNYDADLSYLCAKYKTVNHFIKRMVMPRIKKSASSAYEFLVNSGFKGRWPGSEPYIMKSPYVAYLYAENIIMGKWPEAEPYIMKDSKAAVAYAHVILDDRWPEAEPHIMKHRGASYPYARDVIKGRWPEAEKYIESESNSRNWNHYLRFVMQKEGPNF